MPTAQFQPLNFVEYSVGEMRSAPLPSAWKCKRRRTVRHFSDRPVPREIIEECLLTAGTAPNGANLQPWHFVVVSDPKVKHEIRMEAEKEEESFIIAARRRNGWTRWRRSARMNTSRSSTSRPYLIAIFGKNHSELPDGRTCEKLLRQRVGGNCHRLFDCVASPRRLGLTHAHAQPDGILKYDPQHPRGCKTIFISGRWLPCQRCPGAGHHQEAIVRDCTFM